MNRRTNPSAETAQNRLPRRSTRAHVLVVDDKEIVRNFLSEVLTVAGNRVTAVSSGEQALATCREDLPEVVLTDLRMEPMGGGELIERLRELSSTTVPIVLTGYGSVECTVELMRLGAFDVLTKPCRAADIVAAVDKAVAHHHALRDASRLERTETQRNGRRPVQEKLAMIGKLAAGVAHELNNPLDATLRCVRLCKERAVEDPEATEYLDLAHAGLLRMADIVQSLLTFSREAAAEQTPQPLDDLIREAITSVGLALGPAAPRMSIEIGARVAACSVPRGLHQVLTNLLRNAADACAGAAGIDVRASVEGERLAIQVADEGTGIPPEVLPRVFEPFFTTKEPGKGTGLGLPISARLVEKFGGTISIECPAEGGTIVTVALPAGRYAPEEAKRVTT